VIQLKPITRFHQTKNEEKTMRSTNLLACAALVLSATVSPLSADNNITANLPSVEVIHNGEKIIIHRAEKSDEFSKGYGNKAHKCPPFCIQPMEVAPGIQTVGELEVLGYLHRIAGGDSSVIVVDSRTPEWLARGTIPGSINVPWTKINVDVGDFFSIEAEAEEAEKIMTTVFNANLNNGKWDFSNAKTLVLYCNGAWCPQSSNNIKTLARLGYPANKLKWYRGGMQSWVGIGLSTVKH
jgi:rhodanese-related sulfurtransferase